MNSELNNAGPAVGDRTLGALRKCTVWILQNELFRRCCRLVPDAESFVLRNEDLATDPAATLAQAMAHLGLAFDGDAMDDFWDRARSHALGGNPMRHRRREIYLDERWRDQLSDNEQRIIQATTGAWRRKYRY